MPASRLAGRTVLVVAHDFPPISSPQAIRATFFCQALVSAGAVVHVLTRSGVVERPLPSVLHGRGSSIVVQRCSPGTFENAIAWLARRRERRAPVKPQAIEVPAAPAQLNWKGRAVKRLRHALGALYFPDERSAWVPHAARWIASVGRELQFDAALLMHEPAAGVRLWKDVDSLGIPWGVDLADPVLAPYTRRHWRRLALRLESDLVGKSRIISVTNAETASVLARRHDAINAVFKVIPQGYVEGTPGEGARDTANLVLLYTGRFYAFRTATALLEAIGRCEGVTLKIAGPELPSEVLESAKAFPEKIQILGELPHEKSIEAQKRADVLVSIGNRGSVQTPGKVIEYFGAHRPLLHIAGDSKDPIPTLLATLNRGMCCPNDASSIATLLEHLQSMKRQGRLDSQFDLRGETVAGFSWTSVGKHVVELVERLAESKGSGTITAPR